jgi:transcriptional regulator with XRE-family HTH domain
MSNIDEARSLKDLRNARNMSASQVARLISAALNEGKERNRMSVIMFERRGVKKYEMIKALASIYRVPIKRIEDAAKHSVAEGSRTAA